MALISLFLGVFFIDAELFGALIDRSFAWSAQYFGLFWQVLMLINFLIALWIATRSGARRVLGALDTPEFSNFQEADPPAAAGRLFITAEAEAEAAAAAPLTPPSPPPVATAPSAAADDANA